MTDLSSLLTDRVRGIRGSGIRRVFELAASLPDPINLSIGQPDFPVPDPIKRAAVDAVEADRNGYTMTDGIAPLKRRLGRWLADDVGWSTGDDAETAVMVTSGTSGALLAAFMALVGPGDEAILPDPYFVMYPVLAQLTGGRAVFADTYPDFRLTAERVEPLISDRTRLVLLNSPGNPSGVVMSTREVRDLLDLCRAKGVVLISDEIYDEFTYPEARSERSAAGDALLRCPSPCRAPGSETHTLLIRGFGKTYGVTGWRLGYAAGPRWLLDAMHKVQQFTFVCPPAPLQLAAIAALDVDMRPLVEAYAQRRDAVLEALSPVTAVASPGGAFYAFAKVPERLGLTGTQLAEQLVERNVLVIPGGVFSNRDTHIRISFAAPLDRVAQGARIIADAIR